MFGYVKSEKMKTPKEKITPLTDKEVLIKYVSGEYGYSNNFQSIANTLFINDNTQTFHQSPIATHLLDGHLFFRDKRYRGLCDMALRFIRRRNVREFYDDSREFSDDYFLISTILLVKWEANHTAARNIEMPTYHEFCSERIVRRLTNSG